MRTRPIIIAHRGNSGRAPENTLISIQQAIDLGVDMVEVDVNISKDLIPVLIHDKFLDNTTDGEGEVRNFTLAELKKFDAGSWKGKEYKGERIPTLAEAFELATGKVALNLDSKSDDDVIPHMVREIQRANMVDQVVISGCLVRNAKQIHSLEPKLTVLLDMESEIEALADKGNSAFISKYISQACEAHLSALNLNHKYVNQELIRGAHLRALSIWTWTVDNEGRMRELIQMGVDAITTNWPERLAKIRDSES